MPVAMFDVVGNISLQARVLASPTTAYVDVDGLAHAAGVDVDVDDGGVRRETGEVAGHAVIEAGTDRDQARRISCTA